MRCDGETVHNDRDDRSAARTHQPHEMPRATNVTRLAYSTAECAELASLLQRRSEVWPSSLRKGIVDANMRKSCIVAIP